MIRRTAGLLAVLLATPAAAQDFSFNPPGQLVPGSGQGRVDDRVYVPGMLFPIEQAPSFANSQVWGHGGSQGPGGGQCDAANYSYPWSDNFCESRQWNMPLCPSGTGHQGQDIRPSTCENRRWWTVAAEDGTITNIGSYSVYLQSDTGTRHRYLHMDPGSVTVNEGQRVRRGDRLGLVSNSFDGTPTTIHLHYDLNQNVAGVGNAYVPTYMSLVRSYEQLLGAPAVPCATVARGGGVLDNQSPCFDLFGPPATWRHVQGEGQGGDLYWTYAWTHDNPSNWARWRLVLDAAGEYDVDVFLVAAYASSRRAIYGVRAAGRERDVALDLSRGAGWVRLGTFDFAAGGDQWIAAYDNTGEDRGLELRVMSDAIRLSPAAAPPPPDADMPPPPRDAAVGPGPADAFVGPDPPDAYRPPPARDAGGPDAYRPPMAFDAARPVPQGDANVNPGSMNLDGHIVIPRARDASLPGADGSPLPASQVRLEGGSCIAAAGRDGNARWWLLLFAPIAWASRRRHAR